MKQEQKDFLKATCGEIPFLSEGIASDTSGFLISEDGLTKLAEAAMNNAGTADQVAQLQQQLNEANTAKANAETALAGANSAKKTAEDALATANARIEELESEGSITQTQKESDKGPKTGKTPFHASDNNPFNQIADSLMGKPKVKSD